MQNEQKPDGRQLVNHVIEVEFHSPSSLMDTIKYQAANVSQSRQCGWDIAEWLARGVGYKVVSQTIELYRR